MEGAPATAVAVDQKDQSLLTIQVPSIEYAPRLTFAAGDGKPMAVLTTMSQRSMRLAIQLLDRLDQIVYGGL